ncbi:hypothetical protein [Deinococcus multiflagellatus]|uniref:Uncharacterized protein n=1 Tax=Deinococcus multiflagellatus TaxID=1656887 RepID=A0ABW1ZHE5_9DEIO
MSAPPAHPGLPTFTLPLEDPAFLRDPYPLLAELRAWAPAFYDPGMGRVVLTRHAEISAALRDRRLGRSALHRYSRDELGWPPPTPGRPTSTPLTATTCWIPSRPSTPACARWCSWRSPPARGGAAGAH